MLSFFGSLLNNLMGQQREEEARLENYRLGEMAADKADQRTRKLYEDYQSPSALLRQFKSAGLSPSLMFANGAAGAGGMTQGAQGTGASGISPTTFGGNLMEDAQLKLIEAQAKKTNAEANTILGETPRGSLEISKLEQEVKLKVEQTKNTGLKNAWYEYENALQEMRVGYEASTWNSKIENYLNEVTYLKHRVRSAAVKADIDEQTQSDVQRLVKENVRNVIADTLLKNMQKKLAEKNIQLQDEQIQDLISQIENRSKQTQINRETLSQNIREWAVKNGIVTDEHTNWSEVTMKNLLSEHTQELVIKLIDALMH